MDGNLRKVLKHLGLDKSITQDADDVKKRAANADEDLDEAKGGRDDAEKERGIGEVSAHAQGIIVFLSFSPQNNIHLSGLFIHRIMT